MASYEAIFLLVSCFVCYDARSVVNLSAEHFDGELTTQDNAIFQQTNLMNTQYAKTGDHVCMKELGCFYLTKDFFHVTYRPLNRLPQDRVTIDTKFHLYSKDHPKEAHDIHATDLSKIKEIPLDPTLQTKFIVHGYLDNKLYGKWMETLKDNFLLHGSYNVIIVDWSGGNALPYTQATANTRVVGAEIAHFIKILGKIKGLSPKNCHIIGHSLGSHIAGYAGEKVENLGRITGLDPAGPFFENMPPIVRLDPTDADFVDVIHTDAKSILLLGLGMDQACGHVDFYPNGGKNQPGCRGEPIRSILMEGFVDAVRQFVACSHQRAVDFFTYSINYRRALPVGYQCPSYTDYINGRCGDCGRNGERCAIMGHSAAEYKSLKNDSQTKKFYLTTLGTKPFFAYHYQLGIKLWKSRTGLKDQNGKIIVTIFGEKGSVESQLTPQAIDLYHGAKYNYLVTTGKELGIVKALAFQWKSSGFSFFRRPEIYLEKITLVPLNVIQKEERMEKQRTFCDKPDKAVKSSTTVHLTQTNCP